MQKIMQISGLISIGVIGVGLENFFSAGNADIVGICVLIGVLISSFVLTAVLERNIIKTGQWITVETLVPVIVVLVKTSLVYSSLSGSAIMLFWGLVAATPLLAILAWAFHLLAEKE